MLETRSTTRLLELLPDAWLCEKPTADYGVDVVIECFAARGSAFVPTGELLLAQIKARSLARVRNGCFEQRIAVSTLRYLAEVRKEPSILFFYADRVAESDFGFESTHRFVRTEAPLVGYVHLRPYVALLDAVAPGWRDCKTVSLKIPVETRVDDVLGERAREGEQPSLGLPDGLQEALCVRDHRTRAATRWILDRLRAATGPVAVTAALLEALRTKRGHLRDEIVETLAWYARNPRPLLQIHAQLALKTYPGERARALAFELAPTVQTRNLARDPNWPQFRTRARYWPAFPLRRDLHNESLAMMFEATFSLLVAVAEDEDLEIARQVVLEVVDPLSRDTVHAAAGFVRELLARDLARINPFVEQQLRSAVEALELEPGTVQEMLHRLEGHWM